MRCIACIMLIAALNAPVLAVPGPVIFVHGIGDSSHAWSVTGPEVSGRLERYYGTGDPPHLMSGSGIVRDRDDRDFTNSERNSCVYVTFSDYYASPEALVPELKKVIDDTRREVFTRFPRYFRSVDEVRVNLVAHSMGGLVCREYLVRNPGSHNVDRLIMISTPNLGSTALDLTWAAWIIYPFIRSRGSDIYTPAAESMRTGSEYLIRLNRTPMPENVKYRSLIAYADDIMSRAFNFTLGYWEGGDGAVSASSQGLRSAGIPNFSRLDYAEIKIKGPHFKAFKKAAPAVIELLGLD